MVFHFLSGLLGLLTSSLVYIIGSIIFAKDLVMIVTFILALLVLSIVIGVMRMFHSESEKSFRNMFRGMRARGHSLTRILHSFKNDMRRELVCGSSARAAAFGLVLFLFTNNVLVVYASIVAVLIPGIIMIIARRHNFFDLILGIALGIIAGFTSYKFAPLLIALVGF